MTVLPARPPGDAGDQQQRTLLAWRRTALSLVAVGALVGRLAFERTGGGPVAAGLAVLAVMVAAVWLTPGRRTAVAGACVVGGVLVVGALGLLAVVGG